MRCIRRIVNDLIKLGQISLMLNKIKISKTVERIIVGVCLIFVFVLYAKTFHYQKNLDDSLVLNNNPIIENGWSGISEVFTTNQFILRQVSCGYRPISKLFVGVQSRWSENNYNLHHKVNVGIYLLIILLFYFSFAFVFNKNRIILLIAVWLFTIHPIHTEVVCSIKNQDELLGLFFGLSSFACLAYFIKTRKPIFWFALHLLFLLFAMLSKINALLLIPVFAIFIILERGLKKTIPFAFAYFCLAIGLIAFLFLYLPNYTRPYIPLEVPYMYTSNFIEVLNAKFYSIGTHLYKMIIPWTLFSYYGLGEIPVDKVLRIEVLFAGLAAIGLSYSAFVSYKTKNILILFAIAWLISSFIIPSNLIMSLPGVISERAMFTPSIAMCLLLSSIIFWTYKQNRYSKYFSILVFLVLSCFYFYKSNNRIIAWENQFELSADDIRQGSNSAKVLYIFVNKHLARYKEQGKEKQDLEKAKHYIGQALELFPDYNSANNKYGLILARYENKLEEGIVFFKKAVNNNPEFEDALLNLGSAYHAKGDLSNAIKCMSKVLKINPLQSKAKEIYETSKAFLEHETN